MHLLIRCRRNVDSGYWEAAGEQTCRRGRRAEHAVLNPNKSEAGTRTGDTRRGTQVGIPAVSCVTPPHPHERKLTWRTSRTASVVPRKLSSGNVDLAVDGPRTTTTSRIHRVSSSASFCFVPPSEKRGERRERERLQRERRNEFRKGAPAGNGNSSGCFAQCEGQRWRRPARRR